MANAHELARGHKRLRALIEFALAEGWHVKRTPGGHLKFTKRLCADLHQFDGQRPSGQPQCRGSDPPRRSRGPLRPPRRGEGRWAWLK